MTTSASWRIAFRVARRIVRSHPFRSLLIAAMIALPVFGLSAHAVLSTTWTFSDAERLDRQIGAAPAAVILPSEARDLGFEALPYLDGQPNASVSEAEFGTVLGTGPNISEEVGPATFGDVTVAQGYAATDPWTTERVGASVGSPVVATRSSTTSLEAGNVEFPSMGGLFADANNPILGSSVNLVSGRWPAAANEVAVSQLAVGSGAPTSGTIDIRVGPGLSKQTFDIVGVGDASIGTTSSVDNTVAVFALEAAPQDAGWRWLIDRDAPVGIKEATDLTAYGLTVISRDIGPADDGSGVSAEDRPLLLGLRVTSTAALLLLAMALAAPAFAISATERRRDLALLHAQGASPADLRRHVLAYGVILAGVSTLAAAIAGSGAMFLYLRSAVPEGQEWFFPMEMPWLTVALIAFAAFGSAMVAAWLPARRVMRSAALPTSRVERPSPKKVKSKAIASGVALLVGIFLLAAGSRDPEDSSVLLLGIALTTAAGLSAIPAVLAGVGRWARHGPIALRMAIAEISRQRARSTPAVAAVAGVVGVMIVSATVLSEADPYLPEVLLLLTVVTVISLAATLIVTALTTSYNKEASTTLDIIGASTSVRRSFAGSYAAAIAGIGGALGIVFGLMIGWASASWSIATQKLVAFPDPEVPDAPSIPWMWLAVAVVLPVLAYGLAWITVPPAKTEDVNQRELSRSR